MSDMHDEFEEVLRDMLILPPSSQAKVMTYIFGIFSGAAIHAGKSQESARAFVIGNLKQAIKTAWEENPGSFDQTWTLSANGAFLVPIGMTHMEFLDRLCAWLESIGAAWGGSTKPDPDDPDAAVNAGDN